MKDVGKMTDTARLEFVRTFPVDRETLWAYLVEDEKRRKWICGGVVEPRAGGTIVFDFDHRRLSSSPPPGSCKDEETVRFEGKVLVWEPPNRLAFSWPEADEVGNTEVTMTLTAIDGGTELQLVHERLVSEDYRLGAAAGWHAHLDLLDDILAGRPARDFWIRHAETETLYRDTLPGV